MIKKLLILIICLTAAACFLAGCKSEITNDETKSNAGADENTTEESLESENEETPSNSVTISENEEEDILRIVVNDSYVTKDEMINYSVSEDTEDGWDVFVVTFESSEGRYKYEIIKDANAILSMEYEIFDENIPAKGVGTLSEDSIKALAMAYCSLGIDTDVNYTKLEKATDDGAEVFEVEFNYNGTEYELEIHASQGTLIEKSVKSVP